MEKVLWELRRNDSRLSLFEKENQACLAAFKDYDLLGNWRIDSVLAAKVVAGIDDLLSGRSIVPIYPQEGECFSMHVEKVVAIYCFDFCKGANLNIGSNCISFVIRKGKLEKLHRILSGIATL